MFMETLCDLVTGQMTLSQGLCSYLVKTSNWQWCLCEAFAFLGLNSFVYAIRDLS